MHAEGFPPPQSEAARGRKTNPVSVFFHAIPSRKLLWKDSAMSWPMLAPILLLGVSNVFMTFA